jgi:Holliday junction resolvasome RuvABC ATP-dependent DNA helicase subunit
MLFRTCRGVLRVASRLLRAALRIAHDKGQAFIDEPTLQAALDELGITGAT